MTPEEQQALAAQALQSYQAPPAQMSGPELDALANAAAAKYAAPAPAAPPPAPAMDMPGQLAPADQQALGQAALTGYSAAPPAPTQPWTDPNTPGPGAITDAQLLEASQVPPAAAAVPPAAMAGNAPPEQAPEPAPAPPPALPPPTNFKEGIRNYLAAASHQEGEEKKAAALQADLKGQEAALAGNQSTEWAERGARHEKAIDEQYRARDLAAKAFSEANDKAEALSHIEHQETTRSKIAGMLALFGGGLADAFAIRGGDPNPQYFNQAQANIDKAVQMDLAKQREAYNNAKEGAKAKETEYSIARQMLGDTPESDKLANVFLSNRMASDIAQQSAKSDSEQMRAAGQVLAAQTRTKAAKDVAELLEKSRHIYTGVRPTAMDVPVNIKATRELIANEESVSPRAAAVVNAIDSNRRGETGTNLRVQTAEEKAEAAAALERKEIIPGFIRRPNMTPLSHRDEEVLKQKYASTVGLKAMADELGGLWDQVMDESLPEEQRAAARSRFAHLHGRLLSGESVDTGQGTITASDAKRMGDSTPFLPPNMDLGGIVTWARNKWKGQLPNADTLRAIGTSAIATAHTKLREAYGVVPAEEGEKLWAAHDAKQATKKPKGESAPPKGETKGSEKPALPEGKVAVVRKDGLKGMVSKDDPGLKDGTYRVLQ